jgi:AcrR family transcriptional regulator
MPEPDPVADRILAAALAEAEATGWYDLRLAAVAARAGVPLAAVLAHYRDADAIADAWFVRALAAMLAGDAPDPADPPSLRVETALMRWFAAQASHRAVAGAMLRAKLHLSHPHHWVPMVFSLSRLVHWVLEAARLDARGLARQAEEVGLTLVLLRALAAWQRDPTPGLERTRAVLRRSLGWLDRLPRR